jgi:hypothetical protein
MPHVYGNSWPDAMLSLKYFLKGSGIARQICSTESPRCLAAIHVSIRFDRSELDAAGILLPPAIQNLTDRTSVAACEP